MISSKIVCSLMNIISAGKLLFVSYQVMKWELGIQTT